MANLVIHIPRLPSHLILGKTSRMKTTQEEQAGLMLTTGHIAVINPYLEAFFAAARRSPERREIVQNAVEKLRVEFPELADADPGLVHLV